MSCALPPGGCTQYLKSGFGSGQPLAVPVSVICSPVGSGDVGLALKAAPVQTGVSTRASAVWDSHPNPAYTARTPPQSPTTSSRLRRTGRRWRIADDMAGLSGVAGMARAVVGPAPAIRPAHAGPPAPVRTAP